MERETKKLSIGSNTFTIKTYATARELNTIQSAYFKGSKVEIVGETPKISEFDPSVQYNVQLEMIRQLVVSINGDTAKIVESCEELPSEQFDELCATLDGLVAKKKS